jgi:enamine deaminase RidA (YjgF/YER057c/UK114 family)
MSIERIEPGKHLSKAVVHNGIVYVAGQTANDSSQDMAGQTKQVVDAIDKFLEAAGTDKSKLLTAMVYITDMSMKGNMDSVWIPWIDSANPPARACVGTNLGTGKLVEIVVSAAIK